MHKSLFLQEQINISKHLELFLISRWIYSILELLGQDFWNFDHSDDRNCLDVIEVDKS